MDCSAKLRQSNDMGLRIPCAWIMPWFSLAPGCSTPGEATTTRLVEATLWEEVSEDSDPFAAHRPASLDCNPFGYAPEDLDGEPAFYVNTGLCSYLTVEQPAQIAVRRGDTVDVRVYHYELTADQSAEGHVAIAFDGTPVWSQAVAIPADPAWVEGSWTANADLSRGANVQFHVRNHGANEWALVELTVTPP